MFVSSLCVLHVCFVCSSSHKFACNCMKFGACILYIFVCDVCVVGLHGFVCIFGVCPACIFCVLCCVNEMHAFGFLFRLFVLHVSECLWMRV